MKVGRVCLSYENFGEAHYVRFLWKKWAIGGGLQRYWRIGGVIRLFTLLPS